MLANEKVFSIRITIVKLITFLTAFTMAATIHGFVVYEGEPGDMVTWKFEAVDRICDIEDQALKNGAELFSRFLKESEVHSIRGKI